MKWLFVVAALFIVCSQAALLDEERPSNTNSRKHAQQRAQVRQWLRTHKSSLLDSKLSKTAHFVGKLFTISDAEVKELIRLERRENARRVRDNERLRVLQAALKRRAKRLQERRKHLEKTHKLWRNARRRMREEKLRNDRAALKQRFKHQRKLRRLRMLGRTVNKRAALKQANRFRRQQRLRKRNHNQRKAFLKRVRKMQIQIAKTRGLKKVALKLKLQRLKLRRFKAVARRRQQKVQRLRRQLKAIGSKNPEKRARVQAKLEKTRTKLRAAKRAAKRAKAAAKKVKAKQKAARLNARRENKLMAVHHKRARQHWLNKYRFHKNKVSRLLNARKHAQSRSAEQRRRARARKEAARRRRLQKQRATRTKQISHHRREAEKALRNAFPAIKVTPKN